MSPSKVGKSERVIISAAERGRVNGITECGNVFGCKKKRFSINCLIQRNDFLILKSP